MSEEPTPQFVDPAVVDTDILSFWQKKDTRGGDYSAALAGRTLVIAFQTVAEQLRWAEERDWGQQLACSRCDHWNFLHHDLGRCKACECENYHP